MERKKTQEAVYQCSRFTILNLAKKNIFGPTASQSTPVNKNQQFGIRKIEKMRRDTIFSMSCTMCVNRHFIVTNSLNCKLSRAGRNFVTLFCKHIVLHRKLSTQAHKHIILSEININCLPHQLLSH